MKKDRFLIGIMIFIGVIVVAAFVLFFTRGLEQDYLPEGSPESIVNNYALAVTLGDYERAYGYLAEDSKKPSQAAFRSFWSLDPLQNAGLRVGAAEILNGADAVVDLEVIYSSGGPFESSYSNRDSATLVLQEGVWKIQYMPYPYWDFGWYIEVTKP